MLVIKQSSTPPPSDKKIPKFTPLGLPVPPPPPPPPPPVQGAAKINAVVNHFFGAVVACIEAYGGDIIAFAGDALIVEWAAGTGVGTAPTPESLSLALRACRCSLALAQLRPGPSRLACEDCELSLHTSLSCGTVAAMHVGGVGNRFEFLLTGRQVRGGRDACGPS